MIHVKRDSFLVINIPVDFRVLIIIVSDRLFLKPYNRILCRISGNPVYSGSVVKTKI